MSAVADGVAKTDTKFSLCSHSFSFSRCAERRKTKANLRSFSRPPRSWSWAQVRRSLDKPLTAKRWIAVRRGRSLGKLGIASTVRWRGCASGFSLVDLAGTIFSYPH
eukprot:2110630-Prymnesium_polylepis.1